METKFINYLEKIWKNELSTSFRKGIICSKGHLISELYRQLNRTEFNIWVAPGLNIRDNDYTNAVPDIVVTFNQKIIGIIDIKYELNKVIDFKENINKLNGYSKLKELKIPLKIDIKTGDWNKKELYKFNSDFVTVFAVIAWAETDAVDSLKWKNKIKKLPDNFYHFIGSVSENKQLFFIEKVN